MVEAKILIADDSKMNQQILSEILGGRYEYLMPTTACRRSSCCTPSSTSTCCSNLRTPYLPPLFAYELGVTDYIRRPFNLTVTQRRVSSALTLYARQKHLVHLAEEQVYEHEKTNSAIINILSHVVESRNFESGTHILHVRAITNILLRQLVCTSRNGAQNRKEASWLTTNFSPACSPQRRR